MASLRSSTSANCRWPITRWRRLDNQAHLQEAWQDMTSQQEGHSKAKVIAFSNSPLTWKALPISLNFSWSCDSEKNTEHQNAHKVFSNLRRTRGDIQLSRHLMLGWEIVRTCLAKTLDEGTTGMKKNTMASCVLNGTNLFPTSFERKLKLAWMAGHGRPMAFFPSMAEK